MSAIRVIQFTDPHLFGDAAGTLRGVNTLETLERTLADVMPRWLADTWRFRAVHYAP